MIQKVYLGAAEIRVLSVTLSVIPTTVSGRKTHCCKLCRLPQAPPATRYVVNTLVKADSKIGKSKNVSTRLTKQGQKRLSR